MEIEKRMFVFGSNGIIVNRSNSREDEDQYTATAR